MTEPLPDRFDDTALQPSTRPPGGASSISASVVPTLTDRVVAAERELDAARFAIPLPSRVEWARYLGNAQHHTAVAHGASGSVEAMIGVSLTRTRALPLHRIARVEACGEAYATAAGRELLVAVADFARRESRILRVVVEVESRDDGAREVLTGFLREAGYQRIASERVSERTLAIDLRPTEEAMFAALSRRGRQNIRLATKQGLETAVLDDPRYGDRMNALLVDAMARTGAASEAVDWNAIFSLSRALPHRSRVSGVFRGASRDVAALVGYAWALHHGDRVEYNTGASDRLPGESLPILYPALWDLVLWGKRSGGTWFDLGGVSPGDLGSGDALGGISHFKRGFSKVEVALGEEWVFTPHPLRARVADWASRTARRLRERARGATSVHAPHAEPASGAGSPSADESRARAGERHAHTPSADAPNAAEPHTGAPRTGAPRTGES